MILRSIHLRVFYKKGVLRNFAKFTEKHMYRSLIFNKVAGLQPARLLKRDSDSGVFLQYCEISNNTFFYGTQPVAVGRKKGSLLS